MPTSRSLAKQVVGTYASVLFEAAAASDAVDTVSTQLDAVLRLVRSHAPLRDAMADDATSDEAKAGTIRTVLAGLQPELVEAMAILAERGDFNLLPSIIDAYADVAEEKRGIVAVDVTTAIELSDGLRESIKKKLVADMGKDVALRETVDPSIIGGIVISAHGQRIDASIASQLENARKVLSTAHTGGEA